MANKKSSSLANKVKQKVKQKVRQKTEKEVKKVVRKIPLKYKIFLKYPYNVVLYNCDRYARKGSDFFFGHSYGNFLT